MSNKTKSTSHIRWKCRRGMLELDLLLLTFFEKYYATLTIYQQATFARLLDQEDQDLQKWLFRQIEPEDHELKDMVKLINDATKKIC